MPTCNENPRSLLLFHASGLGCAFPLEAVLEILPIAELSTPPGLPSLLAGFLDRSGTAIPILQLDRLFNLPPQPWELHTPFIILRGDGNPIGLLAGAVRKIAAITPESYLPLPANHVLQDCATATVAIDGDMFHLLSPERLLLAHERGMIEQFRALAQDRLRCLEEAK
jgi:purine-binding chemotaxis protein CheW